jgi:hypothetical protein
MQTSTTNILSRLANRPSRTNLSMTQNKIAPTTTMIRMFIKTKSNATSRWRHLSKSQTPEKIAATLRQSTRREKRSGTNGAVFPKRLQLLRGRRVRPLRERIDIRRLRDGSFLRSAKTICDTGRNGIRARALPGYLFAGPAPIHGLVASADLARRRGRPNLPVALMIPGSKRFRACRRGLYLSGIRLR